MKLTVTQREQNAGQSAGPDFFYYTICVDGVHLRGRYGLCQKLGPLLCLLNPKSLFNIVGYGAQVALNPAVQTPDEAVVIGA